MIFSLLLFITQWDFISSCSLTQSAQQMVYPVIGQNYVLNLDEYFEGSQLQYTTGSTYPIRQQVTYNDIAATNFPATSTMIATASNQNQVTAILGETIAVLLFDTGNYYVYVGQVGLDNKTPITWTQLAQPISNYSSVSCSSLLILSNQDVVVSCVQQSINQQLLYYFEEGSTQDVMPYLYQTGIILDQNAQYVEFQAINLAYYQWQIYITYSDNTTQNSTIYAYNVTSKDPTVSLNPLIFISAGSVSFPQAIVGSYIVNPYTSIIAFNDSVIVYDMITQTTQSPPLKGTVLGMSAFPLGNSYESFQIIVTLLFPHGLQNYYFAQIKTYFNEMFYSEFMPFPLLYTADSSASLITGPEFVVLQDPTQQVVYVYPGWLNSNDTQNYIWTQTYTSSFELIFNTYSQDIYLFGLNGQALIHLGTAYMLINIPVGSTTGNQTVIVTANDKCSVNFTITPVLGSQLNSQIYYSTSESQKRVAQLPIQVNQQKTAILNGQFVGANLTYTGVVTPQSESQANIIQSIQVSLDVQEGDILFSQILPCNLLYRNPEVDFLYVLQLNTKKNTLLVYFCNDLACGQVSSAFVGSTVLGAATSNNFNTGQSQNFLAIFLSNSTQSVQVYALQGYTIKGNTMTNILVNQVVPTMTVSSIQIVSEILYIITATPQTLQVVPLNNLTDIQVFEGYDIVPRQIYSSPLYPNLIFLDNTYELQIYRVPNQFMDLKSYYVQTLPYQLSQGSSVGVGILFNGIYIAESNGTNQALTLYPTQALDSFLNTPLSNLAISIPLLTYNINIQNPVISSFSSSNFYLSIIASDLTNQLGVFQYTGAQLNVLYFSQYLPSAASSISLASVIFGQGQSYDVLCYQYTGKVAFYQITNNTYADFIPGTQTSEFQSYSVIYTATTPGQQSLNTEIDLSVVISGKYITPTPTQYVPQNQAYTYFGRILINPANYFTGFVQSYETGYKTKSAQLMQNSNEIIQPIISSPAFVTTDSYMSATSSYGNAYIIDSSMQVNQYQNIPNLKNYYPLYQMNSTFTSCPYMFMYNAGLLVIVCTNTTDSYLVYSNNQTITSFTTIIGMPLPDLISAQFNQSQAVFALENTVTNTKSTIYQLTVIQITYDGSKLKQFGTGLIQKTFKQQTQDYGIFATLNSSNNVYSFGIAVITDSKVVKLYAMEQDQTSFALTVAKSYTIVFPPSPYDLDFIGIQMYSVGTYNANGKNTTNMIFVLQTTTIGYVYQFTTNPTATDQSQASDFKAKLLHKLMPLDQIEAITMLVQNTSIVTVYQNGTDRTIVGVFTLPDQGYPIVDLYLISYVEVTNFQVSNFQLSQNGTLFFQNKGQTTQIYITPNVIVSFNIGILKQYKNLVEEAQTSGISLVLKAINQNLNSTIEIQGSLVAPQIDGNNSINLYHGLHIGLGVFFFCIVAGALTYLCMHSQRKADDYTYNGRQEVEM